MACTVPYLYMETATKWIQTSQEYQRQSFCKKICIKSNYSYRKLLQASVLSYVDRDLCTVDWNKNLSSLCKPTLCHFIGRTIFLKSVVLGFRLDVLLPSPVKNCRMAFWRQFVYIFFRIAWKYKSEFQNIFLKYQDIFMLLVQSHE